MCKQRTGRLKQVCEPSLQLTDSVALEAQIDFQGESNSQSEGGQSEAEGVFNELINYLGEVSKIRTKNK